MSYFNQNGSTFDEKTGLWIHNFSQSFIGGFQHCPEQARADYFQETPKDDYTDSTALGTAAHAGAEYALEEKRDREVPPVHDVIEVAFDELEGIGEWKYTKLSLKQIEAALPRMISAFMADVLPRVDPLQIELRFKVPLYRGKKRQVNLVGTMDCLDVNGLPWDWKTASRAHDVWEKQRWATQPTVYTYAAQWLEQYNMLADVDDWPEGRENDFEMVPSEFMYGVMLHNGDTQVYPVHRDATFVTWLRQVASQIAWMVEHDVKPWPLNDGGWWCSEKWCPLWSECKGKYMEEGWMKAPRAA